MKQTLVLPKLMFLALALGTALSGCGQMISPKKSTDLSGAIKFSVLDAATFASQCQQASGVLVKSNSICVSAQQFPLNQQQSSTLQDVVIEENFTPGKAITASGSAPGGVVQVMLNGSPVVSVPQSSPVTVNGSGRLHFRLAPGSWTNVSVTVYTCRDQGWRQIYCPTNGLF